MLGRLGRDASSLLGVEITPPFIRLVLLRRHHGRYSVQGWALEPLPTTAMHDGWISDPEQVGAALRQAVLRVAGRGRRVAVSLPAGLVIERLISMPAGLADEAIVERLPLDAGEFIPFALDDAAVDFQVVGPDPDDPQCQQIVVAACHLALIEALEASLEAADLRACVVEPDSHALRRVAQVDAGSEGLLLQVEGGALAFHVAGAGPVWQRHEIPFHDQRDSVQALVAAVDNYLLSDPQRPLPALLLLSGAGASDIHLPEQLQQRLGMPVRHVEPFKDLVLGPAVEAQSLMLHAPYLAIACGLAMREGERCLK